MLAGLLLGLIESTYHMSSKTPLLLKQDLVGILFNSILQAVNITLGNVFAFQRYLKTSIWGPLTVLTRHLYVELTVKHPGASLLHRRGSFSSFITLTLEMRTSSSASIKVSHSNLPLLQLKVHLHSEPSHPPTSSTLWPWFNDRENNLGNKVFSFEFPTHTSSQKRILSPLPIFQPTSSWNHPSPPPSLQILVKSLHHQDWYLTGKNLLLPPYRSMVWIAKHL